MTEAADNEYGVPPVQLRLIQMIYDQYVAEGKWPYSRSLQIAFLPDDFWSVVRQIDHHLLQNRGEIHQPDARTSLTIEGVVLCSNSGKDVSLFFRALRVCIDIYKATPQDPTVAADQLRQSLQVTESECQRAMELLLSGQGIWRGASMPEGKGISQVRLSPGILKYNDVESISEYLEITRRDRHPATAEATLLGEYDEARKTLLTLPLQLHHAIGAKCDRLINDGHYSEAVQASFKVVLDRLRELTGHERPSDAFGKCKLHISGTVAPNVEDDFNKGVMFLSMAIGQFRNAFSHTSRDQIDGPDWANEYLALSSLAIRFLDRAASRSDESVAKS